MTTPEKVSKVSNRENKGDGGNITIHSLILPSTSNCNILYAVKHGPLFQFFHQRNKLLIRGLPKMEPLMGNASAVDRLTEISGSVRRRYTFLSRQSLTMKGPFHRGANSGGNPTSYFESRTQTQSPTPNNTPRATGVSSGGSFARNVGIISVRKRMRSMSWGVNGNNNNNLGGTELDIMIGN